MDGSSPKRTAASLKNHHDDDDNNMEENMNTCKRAGGWRVMTHTIQPNGSPPFYYNRICAIDNNRIAVVSDRNKKSLEILDTLKNQWILNIPLLPIAFSKVSTGIVLNDSLYIFDRHKVYKILISSIGSGKGEESKYIVEQMKNCNIRRAQGVNVAYENSIYGFGGFDEFAMSCHTLASPERYDLLTNTWTKLSDMKQNRFDPCVCRVKHKIYVIGGLSNRQTLSSVEVYNTTSQKWEDDDNYKVPDLPIPLCATSAVCIDNRWIVVVGGGTQPNYCGQIGQRTSYIYDTNQ